MCARFKKILNEYIRIINGEAADEALRKLLEVHKKRPIKVKDQINNKSTVCFVLSCPGREEMTNNKVCQGRTGINLNCLLEFLNKENPKIFNKANKNDYDILNASPVVHFKKLDDVTEARNVEIKRYEYRFKKYIQGNTNLKIAILLGNKAEKVEDLFKKKKIKVIKGIHIGLQAINRNKSLEGNDYNNTNTSTEKLEEKLKTLAEKILAEISNC